jgi:hypothetical protein
MIRPVDLPVALEDVANVHVHSTSTTGARRKAAVVSKSQVRPQIPGVTLQRPTGRRRQEVASVS